MAVVRDYTFYKIDRIEDDSTCQTQRTTQNSKFSNYVLSNYFAESSSDAHIKFATQQPAILPNGVNGGSGVGGGQVDNESILLLKTEEERALGRLQLLQRPFTTVPYLGRGSCDPDLESQLLQGETVADKKSVSTVMSQSFMGYTLYPTSDKMEEHVKNAKYTVEEAALDGWVRGGAASREMSEDPYMKQTHRPTY
jgi:hypothetical protein